MKWTTYYYKWKLLKNVNLFAIFQIVNIAKNFTNEFNESLAIAAFKHHLTDRKEYFNLEPFPENESNAEAKERCQSIEDAKVFCPKRWASLQLWYEEARKVL